MSELPCISCQKEHNTPEIGRACAEAYAARYKTKPCQNCKWERRPGSDLILWPCLWHGWPPSRTERDLIRALMTASNNEIPLDKMDKKRLLYGIGDVFFDLRLREKRRLFFSGQRLAHPVVILNEYGRHIGRLLLQDKEVYQENGGPCP